jgi:ABC-type multidrug transport system permease subunit
VIVSSSLAKGTSPSCHPDCRTHSPPPQDQTVVFLLVFTSAAFVPATAMPGWLQAFGTHQPVDALVNAERALILGGPAAHDVLISLAWSGGLLVVFALLAARTYARMGR